MSDSLPNFRPLNFFLFQKGSTTTTSTTSTLMTTLSTTNSTTTAITTAMSTISTTDPFVATMNVPVKMAPTENLEGSLSLTTEISTIQTSHLTHETILFSTNASTESATNQLFSRVFLWLLNNSDRLISDDALTPLITNKFLFKPFLRAFLCDSSCEPSNQMPDDEVEKLIEIKSRFFVGSPSSGLNTIASVHEPGYSKRTMIEDFPWRSLEDL